MGESAGSPRRGRRVLYLSLATLAIVFAIALWWAGGGFGGSGSAPSWLTEELIAHRGLHTTDSSERPENSLAAFEAAAAAGLPMELDVYKTADDVIVVVHDDELDRMTGDTAQVTESDASHVTALRLLDTDEPVPTLREVLDLVDGRTPVVIEIKDQPDIATVADAIAAQLESYDGAVAVMSFNPFVLAEMRRAAPEVTRGQLSGDFEGEDLAFYEVFLLRNLLMNWTSKPSFIAYELDAAPTLSTRVQLLMGRPLLVWTAEDEADLERGLKIADNVICDPGAILK